MSWADDAIKQWAAAKLGVAVQSIKNVEFEHEDGFGNDSGTWWPEENGARVQLEGNCTRYIGTEGFSSVPELLDEILDAYLPAEAKALLP